MLETFAIINWQGPFDEVMSQNAVAAVPRTGSAQLVYFARKLMSFTHNGVTRHAIAASRILRRSDAIHLQCDSRLVVLHSLLRSISRNPEEDRMKKQRKFAFCLALLAVPALAGERRFARRFLDKRPDAFADRGDSNQVAHFDWTDVPDGDLTDFFHSFKPISQSFGQARQEPANKRPGLRPL